MPLILPKVRGVRRETNYTGRPSLTWGTVLTSDTVAHTLPAAYTEIIASTTFDTDWVNIWFHTNGANGVVTDSLVNIYVGGAGSEQLVIPNLLAGWVGALGNGSSTPPLRYGFPLRIPAGSRISARHQSVRTSTGVTCMVELLGGNPDHWSGTMVENVGAVAGSSRGTQVTPGTASDGTFTSIGTTSHEWGYIQPVMQGNTDTTATVASTAMDLSADGSAQINGLDEFWFCMTVNEFGCNRDEGRFCHVPTSTTLYARLQSSTSDSEAKSVCLYGVY